MAAPLRGKIQATSRKMNIWRCVTNIRYQEDQIYELRMQLERAVSPTHRHRLQALIKHKEERIAAWQEQMQFEQTRRVEKKPYKLWMLKKY